MQRNRTKNGQWVIEMCFPYYKGSTDKWSIIWGPAPKKEVWESFLDRFTVEVNQALLGDQNGDRLYRLRELGTGHPVLLLGPTSTVKSQTVGPMSANGSQTLKRVRADAEHTLRSAATTLVAEQLDARRFTGVRWRSWG